MTCVFSALCSHLQTTQKLYSQVRSCTKINNGMKMVLFLSSVQHCPNLVFYSSQDKRNEDNKAFNNTNVMDRSKKYAHRECLWKSIFSTPYKWYDCRVNKRNNDAPDFENISSGEGLWILSSTTPPWVKTKLCKLGKEMFAPSRTNNLWEELFTDPSKWFDNRKTKKSSTHPDFVHKSTHKSLWIEDFKTPTWVAPMLNNLQDKRENLWNNYFTDPSKWFDNRKIKKSNNHPDFVHKDTHDALWIDNTRNPTWVISMLDKFKNDASSASQTTENLWKAFFAHPSRWFDKRKIKKRDKHPDFTHKDCNKALWIDDLRTPAWVIPMLNNLQVEAFSAPLSVETLWIAYFSDPSKWFDNRETKKNNKCPDFVHKDTREALWVEGSKTPAWVLPKLNVPSSESLWENFFADLSDWLDDRKSKRSWNSPDFVHKHTGNGLWIESVSTPTWVTAKMSDLQGFHVSQSDVSEETWSALFANPSKWFDERLTKKNPRAPDFRHKETCKGLWIDRKTTPSWVIPSLSKLPNEAFASWSITDRQPQFLFVDPSFLFCPKNEQKDDNSSELILKDRHEKALSIFRMMKML